MADSDVDILIRLRGDAEQRLRSMFTRWEAGGPIMQRFGALGSRAMDAIGARSQALATVLGNVGKAAAAVGSKLNEWAGAAVHRLTSLAKYAALAGAAFAGWQIVKGVQFNAQLEQTRVALAVMYRSNALANRELERTLAFSARTPFRFEELADTVRMLEAFGLTARKWLPTVGDLAAGVNAPIAEIARSLGYLASGRAGEAVQSLARHGVNLRNVPGLAFGAGGQLQTPTPDALAAVQKFLTERYGGMMQRQSRTGAGAWSTLLDNAAILRGRATEGLFERLRDRLIQLNGWMERLGQSRGFNRFLDMISRGLLRAADYVERLIRAMADAYGKTGSLGEALKGGWKFVAPDLKAALTTAAQWFAEALVKALVIAVKAFGGLSLGGKAAVAGVGGLMLAPHAAGLATAGANAYYTARAMRALAGASGAAGATGAGAGAAGGGALAAYPVLPVSAWTGGGGTAAAVGGMGAAAATAALIAAIVAGKIGAWGIGAEAGRFERQGRGEQLGWWDRNKGRLGMAAVSPLVAALPESWRNRLLLGQAAPTPVDMSSAQKGAAAKAEQITLENATFARMLRSAVADYQNILNLQRQIQSDFAARVETIKGLADAVADKMRTPQEQIAARGADVGRLLRQRGGLEATYARGFTGSPTERMEAAVANLRERARLTEDIARSELEILTLREQERQKIVDGNRALMERVLRASPEEKAKLRAVSRYMEGASPEKFMQLPSEYQELYLSTPAGEAFAEKHNLAARATAKAGLTGLLARAPEQANPAAVGAARTAEIEAMQRLADTQAKSLAEAVKAGLAAEARRVFSIELKPGQIDALIQLDRDGKLEAGIQDLLTQFHNEMFGEIKTKLDALREVIARLDAESQG